MPVFLLICALAIVGFAVVSVKSIVALGRLIVLAGVALFRGVAGLIR